MPDTFPPKRMMCGIEEIRATTARIEQLLEVGTDEAVEPKVPGYVQHDADALAAGAVTRSSVERVGAVARAVAAE